MNLELIRTVILVVGWPVLVVAAVIFFASSYKFYLRTHKLALGKIIVASSISQLISMASLGIVATAFLYTNLDTGLRIVFPVFMVWFAVIVATYIISRRWTGEAEKINILYYKIKEHSELLEREKGKLSHVAENMQTGAILLDSNGEVLFINKEARNVLGFDTEGDDKVVLGALYQKFAAYNLKQKVSECISGHPSNILEAESDGKTYEIFLRNLVDTNQQGTAFGHFIWIHDVTKAKALEHAKYNFIKVASHKLRTPLTGLKLNTELLVEECYEGFDEEKRGYLDNIIEANEYITKLTEQLLRAATTNTQDFKVNKESFLITNVVNDVVGKIKEKVEEKEGCSINFTLPDSDEFKVNSDKKLFTEVLQTLVDNAVRYLRKDGECSVTVSLHESDTYYEVHVTDTGIGIPVSGQNLIFNKFFRTESALKIYPNGSGVNLSVAHDIAKVLGGDITFTSTEGVGSTFRLLLPKKS